MYIRDVSEDVAEELKARAAAEGMSLSAYVAVQLTRLTSRPTNSQIADRLRRLDRSGGPTSAEILDEVRSARR